MLQPEHANRSGTSPGSIRSPVRRAAAVALVLGVTLGVANVAVGVRAGGARLEAVSAAIAEAAITTAVLFLALVAVLRLYGALRMRRRHPV